MTTDDHETTAVIVDGSTTTESGWQYSGRFEIRDHPNRPNAWQISFPIELHESSRLTSQRFKTFDAARDALASGRVRWM